MGEVIDLIEYKKEKEANHIEELRAELRDLIGELGGVHMVPIMIMSDMDTTWLPPVVPTPFQYTGADDFSYLVQPDSNEEK